MISTNTENLFLSDAALSAQARREDKMRSGLGAGAGMPYKPAEGSKILCMILSPKSATSNPALGPHGARRNVVYVGESAHVARAIDLGVGAAMPQERTNLKLFKGHAGPVTCVAVESDAAGNDAFLYTGSWDKTIKRWNIKTQSCLATFSAHNDFVKSIVLLPSAILGHIMGASSSAAGQPSASSAKLITSSSDKTICLWNTASGQPEKTLKGHARGVECLDVIFSDPTKDTVTATLVSGGSEGFIRGWDLQHVLNSDRSILDAEEDRIQIQNGHDTSVYGLAVVEGAVWSVSADKSARKWDSENGFKEEMRLEHPDFVRCIAIHPVTGTIFTGCRDEEIRCWDSTTGQLVAEISGHYGEVTSLLIPPNSPTRLLSSSLDGTIRLWDISSEGMLAHAKQWKDKLAEAEEKQQAEKRTKAGVLTEEEERELAELLEDD